MRRCHSEVMSDYRRENNAEMWARPIAPVVVPSRTEFAVAIAEHNLKSRILQAVRIYIEEAGIGE